MRRRLFVPVGAAMLGVLGAGTTGARAQSTKATIPSTDTVSVGPSRVGDTTPSREDMSFRAYLWHTFGPVAMVRAAARGGIDQASDRPSEWARTSEGYAQRTGAHFAASAIGSTMRFGLAALLQQRAAEFVPCQCLGVGSRFLHAAGIPFHAYGRDGWTPSALTPVTEMGSALAVTSVRPGGFNVRDGLRSGAMGLASLSAVSVVHEFWPWPWTLEERWKHRLPQMLQRRLGGDAGAIPAVVRRR